MASQLEAGKRILVMGGGLGGLSYVHYLRNFLTFYNKTHLINKITLVEAGDYMGGSVKTNVFEDGVVHELGPRSIRYFGAKGKNTVMLFEQLGLADRVLSNTAKSVADKDRYVYRDGGLHIVPARVTRLFKKLPATNKSLLSVLRKELFNPKMNLDNVPYQDPAIYDFIAYRFGAEAAESVLDPLIRGITAGDARKLSTQALFGDMLKREQAYGSIMKSLFKPPSNVMRHDELFPHDVLESKLLDTFQKTTVTSYNLLTGLQTLPEHMSNSLLNTNDDNIIAIYNKTRVKSVSFPGKDEAPCSAIVETLDGDHVELKADHIVAAVPANEFAKTLPESMPDEQLTALENIKKIEHVPIACVVIEYRGVDEPLPKVVKSFGFLTHSKAGSRILGLSFDSTLFPEIDKSTNSFRMTAMIGGAWHREVFGTENLDQVSNAQLEQIALEEVRKILKIKLEPYRMSPFLWRTGIAQYTPGHVVRLKETRANITKNNLPLTLLGQSYDGISINDVIYSARLAAYDFVKSL